MAVGQQAGCLGRALQGVGLPLGGGASPYFGLPEARSGAFGLPGWADFRHAEMVPECRYAVERLQNSYRLVQRTLAIFGDPIPNRASELTNMAVTINESHVQAARALYTVWSTWAPH